MPPIPIQSTVGHWRRTGPLLACLYCRCWVLDGVHFVLCHLVWGGRRRCIVPYGVAVAAARMGAIVLRLCRTSTPPANPPVGGCMPVNYCTLGERRRKREREMRNTGRRRRRRRRRRGGGEGGGGGGGARDREREREKPPWL